MKLHPDSYHFTTFITPFGRYWCKRLPFGISSAPEIFQREMKKVLVGLSGVVCQMDDILIYARNQREHDDRLEQVLKRLQESGITLNAEKCEFRKTELRFLGHIIGAEGIKADPEKIMAVTKFPTLCNRQELRRFFGMVNYMGKFSAAIAENSGKLHQLLGKNSDWYWGPVQEKEFACLKSMMASTPTLVPYSLHRNTMLSADSSSFGLGAALLQLVDGVWKPVAFASRSLSSAKQRYAQIKKEALAICWACEKFHYFLGGRQFTVETDHKPLLSILGKKDLAKLPVCVQRFRLSMMSFTYYVVFTPGRKLVLADALSRAPYSGPQEAQGEPLLVQELIDAMPVSPTRLRRI